MQMLAFAFCGDSSIFQVIFSLSDTIRIDEGSGLGIYHMEGLLLRFMELAECSCNFFFFV